MGLKDGLPSLEFFATTTSGLTGQFSGIDLGVAIEAAEQQIIGHGSPTGYGLSVQTGSVEASDVSVNVTFGTAFANEPRVVLTPAQSGTFANQSYVGSTETTGFIFFGQSGLVHNWIAIGSGAI